MVDYEMDSRLARLRQEERLQLAARARLARDARAGSLRVFHRLSGFAARVRDVVQLRHRVA